jgi:hypothetical protein
MLKQQIDNLDRQQMDEVFAAVMKMVKENWNN